MVSFEPCKTTTHHSGLDADGLELGTVHVLGGAGQFLKVDIGVVELARVNLQNVLARRLVRQRELDLAVQTTRTEQCGVKNVDTVGGGNDLES